MESREQTPTPKSGAGSRKRSRAGLAGRKIGPYRITGELGKGGMGVVYRAHDTALDRDVAIKVLPAHLGHDDEFMKRFVREARAAAKVDHPAIVQVYQAGRMTTETGDGPLFIAMQFVDGEPLSDLIGREGHLDPIRALEITKQVAEALGAAHAADMIHRDIKSSNILVGSDGKIKVTDFGLATSMESNRNKITETGAYLGTPEYSSPEQCEGHDLDGRSDVYSLGVVLYEMLTGRVPFEAKTPLKLFDKIVHEEPEPISRVLPGLPRELSKLVSKMLSKERDTRYGGAEELLSAIRRVRVALGSWKRGAGTGRKRPISRRSFRGRNRAELIVAGVAVVLLLVAAGGIWKYAADNNGNNSGAVNIDVNPAPTNPKPPARDEVGVAIFELKNLRKDADNDWIGFGVPNMLIGKLKGLPGLVVYSGQSVRRALSDVGGEDAEAAARKLGARLAVTGSFVVAGGRVSVDVQVVDVVAGRVADAISVSGEEAQILALVDDLGQKLRVRFDVLVARALGRSNRLTRAELKSAREYMFLAALEERKDARRSYGNDRSPKNARAAAAAIEGGAGDKSNKPRTPAPHGRPKAEGPAGDGGVMTPVKRPPVPKASPPSPVMQPVAGRLLPKKKSGTGIGGGEKLRRSLAAKKSKDSSVKKQLAEKAEEAGAPGRGKEPKRDAEVEEARAFGKRSKGARKASARRDIRLALRYRFEGQRMLQSARTKADCRNALAKLLLSESYAANQRGLAELIERARAGAAAKSK